MADIKSSLIAKWRPILEYSDRAHIPPEKWALAAEEFEIREKKSPQMFKKYIRNIYNQFAVS